jgi:hypothetical protein
VKNGCNEEGSFDNHNHHHINPSGVSFGKTRASGKMVSAEMVRSA